MLDSEEYLHLAIHATQNNQHHAALEYLHKCLDLSPENALATFLLAAEHAELGLFNRAIEGLEKCISLNPDIEMAYYQLALLYMQQGDNVKCVSLWQHLSENSREQTLKLFAQGMLLLDTDKTEAINLIQEAAAQETNNKALIASIENILSRLSPDDQIKIQPDPNTSEPMHPMFLNAYKRSSFNPDENQ